MRQSFVVSYDIASPKRLRRVFRLMRGYGDHVQLSVFHCELSATERMELEARLREIIHARLDQVLFIDVGPSEGRARSAIRAVGRSYTHPEVHAIVV